MSNKTIVTKKDYLGITNSFTMDEIRDKYGELVVMEPKEYKKYMEGESMFNGKRRKKENTT